MAEFILWDGSVISVATEDPSKPIYGEDVWFFDAMAGYQGTIKSGSRRLEYSLQLNVRNVFNKSGIYVTDATASGSPVRVAQHIPREVFVSLSVGF